MRRAKKFNTPRLMNHKNTQKAHNWQRIVSLLRRFEPFLTALSAKAP